MRMGLDCDEVYPGIIIGTGPTVKNLKYLVKLGVTHVLNTAENDVNISPGRSVPPGGAERDPRGEIEKPKSSRPI